MNQSIIKVGIVDFREHEMLEPTLGFREIKNTLPTLQAIIGGKIEIPFISRAFTDMGINIIINEEGKLLDLKPSIIFVDKQKNEVVDTVHGNVIFASHDEEGNIISLSSKQIEFIKEQILSDICFIVSGAKRGVVFTFYI